MKKLVILSFVLLLTKHRMNKKDKKNGYSLEICEYIWVCSKKIFLISFMLLTLLQWEDVKLSLGRKPGPLSKFVIWIRYLVLNFVSSWLTSLLALHIQPITSGFYQSIPLWKSMLMAVVLLICCLTRWGSAAWCVMQLVDG